MTNPTECKYCGCEEIATTTDSEIVFRCWSSYVVEDDYWTVSNNCGARCAVQLVEMRERIQQADHDIEFMKAREANFVTALRSRLRTLNERIQRAVEVLEGAERHEMVIDQNGDIDWVDIPEGTMMLSAPANEATAILKGEEDDEAE